MSDGYTSDGLVSCDARTCHECGYDLSNGKGGYNSALTLVVNEPDPQAAEFAALFGADTVNLCWLCFGKRLFTTKKEQAK